MKAKTYLVFFIAGNKVNCQAFNRLYPNFLASLKIKILNKSSKMSIFYVENIVRDLFQG